MLFKDLLQKFFAMSQATTVGVIEFIAAFCGVSVEVVESWVRETAVPRGIVLIKLREIFIGAECTFIEYERIPDPFKTISVLLAYDIINIKDEPYLKMGIPFKDDFLRPITGDRVPGEKRLRNVSKFCGAFEDQLIKAIDERDERFKMIREICQLMDTSKVVQSTVDKEVFKHLFTSVDEIISVLMPMAEKLLKGTAEERQALHDTVNTNKLFTTTNNVYNFAIVMGGLSTETARKQSLGRSKK